MANENKISVRIIYTENNRDLSLLIPVNHPLMEAGVLFYAGRVFMYNESNTPAKARFIETKVYDLTEAEVASLSEEGTTNTKQQTRRR